MCGRYTVAVDPQLLAERFNVALPEDVQPRYNVAPSQPVLAVTRRSDRRELCLLRRSAFKIRSGARRECPLPIDPSHREWRRRRADGLLANDRRAAAVYSLVQSCARAGVAV